MDCRTCEITRMVVKNTLLGLTVGLVWTLVVIGIVAVWSDI